MANCNCSNSSPAPCCSDCPESNPCETGCLDIIDATCIEYTSTLPSCISISNGSKLDYVIRAIDTEICALRDANDKMARVSAMDTTSGYLNDKITTCNILTQEVVTVSGQQKLKLCVNPDTLISPDDSNAIFMDLDGLNINYTTLVEAIVANSDLVQLLCNALDGCTPE